MAHFLSAISISFQEHACSGEKSAWTPPDWEHPHRAEACPTTHRCMKVAGSEMLALLPLLVDVERHARAIRRVVLHQELCTGLNLRDVQTTDQSLRFRHERLDALGVYFQA